MGRGFRRGARQKIVVERAVWQIPATRCAFFAGKSVRRCAGGAGDRAASDLFHWGVYVGFRRMAVLRDR